MVKRKIARLELFSAIQTPLTVTEKNVLPANNLHPDWNVPVSPQTNDTWQVDATMNLNVRCLFNQSNTLRDERQCSFTANYSEWLK